MLQIFVTLDSKNRKNIKILGVGFICHRFVSFQFLDRRGRDYKYCKVAYPKSKIDMQNPLLYFCRHFSPVNRYHKFHSIFSIRHVRIKSILFRLHLEKETDINSFFCKRNFIIRKFRPIKRISDFFRTINYLVNCSLVNHSSNSFKFFCSAQRRKFSNFLSIIFSVIISQKYYSLSRIIVEKIRKEPPRICRMRVHEAPGTKCNSVYRYERQSVQAQHDSLDWNTLPMMGTSPFSPLLHG